MESGARERPTISTDEGGFTIVEMVVALAILAMVMAPLAGVFWSSMRTAGAASHRTDGSSIASREIEGMRAVPYAQVGFYADQPGLRIDVRGLHDGVARARHRPRAGRWFRRSSRRRRIRARPRATRRIRTRRTRRRSCRAA